MPLDWHFYMEAGPLIDTVLVAAVDPQGMKHWIGNQLRQGMELDQIITTFEIADRFETQPALFSGPDTGDRVHMVPNSRRMVVAGGVVRLQQEVEFRTAPSPGTTTPGSVVFVLDAPLAYRPVVWNQEWKARLLRKDIATGAAYDVGVELRWNHLQQFFQGHARLQQRIEVQGGNFLSNPFVADNPFVGFTIGLYDDPLSASKHMYYFHGCDYDPVGIATIQNTLRVSGIEIAPGEIIEVVEIGTLDPTHISFDMTKEGTLHEVVKFMRATSDLIVQCGGIRPSGSSGIGIDFLRIESDYLGQTLIFAASAAVADGAGSSLVDDTTGGTLPAVDATDLRVIVGTSDAPASMLMRDSYSGEAGNVAWYARGSDGAISEYQTSWVVSMRHVMQTIQDGVTDQAILVHVDGGNIDLDGMSLRLSSTVPASSPAVVIREVVTQAGTPVLLAVDIHINVNDEVNTVWAGYLFTVGIDAGGNRVLDIIPGTLFSAAAHPHGDMLSPLMRAVVALASSSTVRRIESNIILQHVGTVQQLSLAVTFRVGGGDVTRVVQTGLTQDPLSGVWYVEYLKWGVDKDNLHRIDWPGLYHGILPEGDYSDPDHWLDMNRNHEETLVGQFQVDDGSIQWLQFTCAAFDAASGFDVLPSVGSAGDYHQGLYGWLEAIGPVIDGVRTRIPVTDSRHPYMLAANLRDGTISKADYEAGMLQVFGWFLQFMTACPSQPGGYYTAPNWPGIEPDSSRPGIPWYPSQDPAWAHVYG
jgi:hypothetical protein